MKVKSEREVVQLCLTLHDPMDCSLPGSSVHGIFQARVLEWSAIALGLGEPFFFTKGAQRSGGSKHLHAESFYMDHSLPGPGKSWIMSLLIPKPEDLRHWDFITEQNRHHTNLAVNS